ncbi:hypothetical protein BBJ28_00016511 [Nothophytophthora sp. Chile5]|nr:hypothetical protein BBJ28_00016511 [Nothophytophthora sp. Chile5]
MQECGYPTQNETQMTIILGFRTIPHARTSMSSTKESGALPLGAVRTADGQVVVPASRRADGSVRKPIRIRQGYVPQDEVPAYKTVAQRVRVEVARSFLLRCWLQVDSVNGINRCMDARACRDASKRRNVQRKVVIPAAVPPSRGRPHNSEVARHDRGSREPRARDTNAHAEVAPAAAAAASAETSGADEPQQLKRQLTKINKQLKEIAKLEAADPSSLSAQQQQKIARKPTLQQDKSQIIATLNGATVTRSGGSGAGRRPKVAISL